LAVPVAKSIAALVTPVLRTWSVPVAVPVMVQPTRIAEVVAVVNEPSHMSPTTAPDKAMSVEVELVIVEVASEPGL
jgi:hypothetical protein